VIDFPDVAGRGTPQRMSTRQGQDDFGLHSPVCSGLCRQPWASIWKIATVPPLLLAVTLSFSMVQLYCLSCPLRERDLAAGPEGQLHLAGLIVVGTGQALPAGGEQHVARQGDATRDPAGMPDVHRMAPWTQIAHGARI